MKNVREILCLKTLSPCLCVALILCASWLSPAFAADEHISVATLPGKPGAVGFSAQFLMSRSGGNGYQPIRVVFKPLGKSFPGERRIEIQVRPRAEWETDLDIQYSKEVVLPQGASVAEFDLYVPHYYRWQRATFRILEDGRLIEKGQTSRQLPDQVKHTGQRTTFGILQARDEKTASETWKRCPDVRTLVTVFGDGPVAVGNNKDRMKHSSARSKVDSVQPGYSQFRRINELTLHESWLGYSQLDVMLVSQTLLSRIEKEQPKAAKAIQDWVAAGGNLWVYGVTLGQNAEGEGTSPWLASISDLKPITKNYIYAPQSIKRSLSLSGKNSNQILQFNMWNGFYSQDMYYQNAANQNEKKEAYDNLVNSKSPMAATVQPTALAPTIQSGTFGLGKIITLQPEDPFPGSFQLWKSIQKINTPKHTQWISRTGVDVAQGNGNYWQWLIAAVGQPPVKAFVALNTLFVVIIGPFLYSFLRRRDRLYLLYFCAPALALFVTGGLFFYALVADGTQTRARARKVTWVDFENNYAINEMHHTYYTVLGAGNGLHFDSDTAVYPFRHSPLFNGYSYRSGSGSTPGDGLISHDDEGQKMTGVLLPSRDQVQYLSLTPQRDQKTVDFDLSGGTVKITNHLNTKISDVLVNDPRGTLWQGKDIGAGETAELVIDTNIVIGDVLDVRVFPDEAEVPELRWRSRYSYTTTTLAGAGLGDTIIETRLAGWKNRPPQGAFIAIAELDPADLAIEATTSQSSHVLIGKLP